MKTMRLLALGLTLLAVNVAFAADEIHWTITGQNSVTFNWRGTTAEKTIGYGLTSGAYTTVTATTPNPVPVSSSGPFWEARLTGLIANTRYYYKIGSGPEKTFRTPPTPGSSDFKVYAQGNIGSTSTYFNTGVVQNIIANDLPSFVVGLGDLTLGSINGKAGIDQHFNDVMAWSREAAYMPVWGDRDTISSTDESFKNYKGRFAVPNSQTSPGSPLAGGEDWYWFDYGNVRFITTPEVWAGALADWQTKAGALMAGAQADPNIKFIVTFEHKAAYSSGHFTGSAGIKDLLDRLGDTYSKYKLNINAHSSNYERSFPQHGVIHVTAGTGGANLVQDGACLWLTCTKPSWSAFRAMHLGALKLRFSASGIEGSFICGPVGGGTNDMSCTVGSVLDRFVIGGPVISAVSALNVTQTGANITWTLDVLSTGQVEYGTTTSYGQMSTKESSFDHSTHVQQLSGLAPATQYHYRVRSMDQAGLEAVSGDFTFTTTDTTAPSVPANLTATVISPAQINLSWNASTDNVAVTGYKVFRNGTQIATVTGTSYSSAGLAASTAYSYTVSSYDAAMNNSPTSASVSATTLPLPDIIAPSVPANLSASAVSSGQINLSWSASTDNVAVTGYKVFRNGVQIAAVTGTSYWNTGLTESTAYSYTVTSYDLAGNNSTISASVSATTLDTTAPSVPANLSASAVSSSQINLSWSASTDNVAVSGYKVFRNGVQIATVTGTSYWNTGLTESTAYSYTVSSYDLAGNNSTISASVNATTLDTTAPSVPVNLSASAVSSSQINLSWSASTDNVAVSGYKVFRNGTQIAAVTGTSYSNTELAESTIYSYTVSSYDIAGNNSAKSTNVSATTTGNSTSTVCAPAPTSPAVVNVTTYGATPNDTTDDTAKIQAAIAAVPTGGTVLVPNGTYMINALTSLRLKSNMTFKMSSGAVLKAITNSSDNYNIIKVDRVSNVNIIGGTIQGDRTTHTGTSCSPLGPLCGTSSVPGATTGMTGQWGMGIYLAGTNNVVIEGVTAKENWGDGFYIGGVYNNYRTQVCSVISDNNRRQGISITYADDVVVKNSIFQNTHGHSPEAGIDIEPNSYSTVNNVKILNSQILSNAGTGISVWNPLVPITNVIIDGNTITSNKTGSGMVIKTRPAIRITNNKISNNASTGLILDMSSNGFITGNTITNNQYIGIQFRTVGTTNNTVSGNTITGHSVAIQDKDGHNIINQ